MLLGLLWAALTTTTHRKCSFCPTKNKLVLCIPTAANVCNCSGAVSHLATDYFDPGHPMRCVQDIYDGAILWDICERWPSYSHGNKTKKQRCFFPNIYNNIQATLTGMNLYWLHIRTWSRVVFLICPAEKEKYIVQCVHTLLNNILLANVNSSEAHTTHLKTPSSLTSKYRPVKALPSFPFYIGQTETDDSKWLKRIVHCSWQNTSHSNI